jgi:hypothetical protein
MRSETTVPFLKSYSELKKFITDIAEVLRSSFGTQVADVEIPILLFAINKLENEDRLRLLSNDYFLSLVPQYNFYQKPIVVEEEGYKLLLKYSLKKLLQSGEKFEAYCHQNCNIIEFKNKKISFYAVTSDRQIANLLKSSYKINLEWGLSDKSPLKIFKCYERPLSLIGKIRC